jgi:hypothetical protein
MNEIELRAQARPVGNLARMAILPMAAFLLAFSARINGQGHAEELPDAPSAMLANAGRASIAAEIRALDDEQQQSSQTPQQQPLPPYIAAPGAQTPPLTPEQQRNADQLASASLPPCPRQDSKSGRLPIIFLPQTSQGCQVQDQLQLIVEPGNVRPLTPTEKGILAARAVTEPFNLLTIAAFSGFSVAFDAHSVYGPGLKGWGRLAGYSMAEDIQGEFTGTFLLPVIFHEDPRYHRMPGRPVLRRVEHALIHTIVTQHDDGSLMLNYATLINYPLSAEISNLYVPGLPTNAPSTAKRVALGYATDPVGPLVAEFLPDFAKRVHVHIVFAQQILNRLALGSTTNANGAL